MDCKGGCVGKFMCVALVGKFMVRQGNGIFFGSGIRIVIPCGENRYCGIFSRYSCIQNPNWKLNSKSIQLLHQPVAFLLPLLLMPMLDWFVTATSLASHETLGWATMWIGIARDIWIN